MLARRIVRMGCTLLLAAGVLLGALIVVPALAGYQRYVIVSGSMTGTYDRGSVVFDEVVAVARLRVGDIITYRPPPDAAPTALITHRIVVVAHDNSGGLVFRTKGDANPTADPWTARLTGARQARVRAGVPYVGFALSALSDRRLRMLVVGLPAALIALSSLAGLWRTAGVDAAAVRT
jgi:signal peptidase